MLAIVCLTAVQKMFLVVSPPHPQLHHPPPTTTADRRLANQPYTNFTGLSDGQHFYFLVKDKIYQRKTCNYRSSGNPFKHFVAVQTHTEHLYCTPVAGGQARFVCAVLYCYIAYLEASHSKSKDQNTGKNVFLIK